MSSTTRTVIMLIRTNEEVNINDINGMIDGAEEFQIRMVKGDLSLDDVPLNAALLSSHAAANHAAAKPAERLHMLAKPVVAVGRKVVRPVAAAHGTDKNLVYETVITGKHRHHRIDVKASLAKMGKTMEEIIRRRKLNKATRTESRLYRSYLRQMEHRIRQEA